jgi:hypothetical protein
VSSRASTRGTALGAQNSRTVASDAVARRSRTRELPLANPPESLQAHWLRARETASMAAVRNLFAIAREIICESRFRP